MYEINDNKDTKVVVPNSFLSSLKQTFIKDY